MLPTFPEFKKLEFTDREAVEGYTSILPVYSDFDFASLWAWNVKEDMEISDLNGNLVIKFVDYTSGEFFYTFVGTKKVTETVDTLITFSEANACGSTLHLLPEESVKDIDPTKFLIEESRDHFDYIYSIERYLTYSGTKLKSRRNFFNSFKKNFPDYEVVELDFENEDARTSVTNLFEDWKEAKGSSSVSESSAYNRFLEVAKHIPHTAVGLVLDGELIAFHVSALPNGEYANGLFEKANVKYAGVYQVLMHEVAKSLIKNGKQYLNYEQDLGIEGLRKSKMAFDPSHFLKKFSVSRIAPKASQSTSTQESKRHTNSGRVLYRSSTKQVPNPMKIKTRILFLVILGMLVIALAGHNFYRYFMVRDYIVYSHTSCDPAYYSCFSMIDATGDPTANNEFYSKVTTDAAHAPKCLDEQNCKQFGCGRDSVGCKVLYCSEETLEDGEVCTIQNITQ